MASICGLSLVSPLNFEFHHSKERVRLRYRCAPRFTRSLSVASSLRLGDFNAFQPWNKPLVLLASNSDLPDEDGLQQKPDKEASQGGPPFLTILAGLVVFLAFGWVIVSILSWLFGLIINVLGLK